MSHFHCILHSRISEKFAGSNNFPAEICRRLSLTLQVMNVRYRRNYLLGIYQQTAVIWENLVHTRKVKNFSLASIYPNVQDMLSISAQSIWRPKKKIKTPWLCCVLFRFCRMKNLHRCIITWRLETCSVAKLQMKYRAGLYSRRNI